MPLENKQDERQKLDDLGIKININDTFVSYETNNKTKNGEEIKKLLEKETKEFQKELEEYAKFKEVTVFYNEMIEFEIEEFYKKIVRAINKI